MKIKKPDYLGIAHDVVIKKMEGDLSFINYMNIAKEGDVVAAVYLAKSPNLEKGHKKYMALYMQGSQLYVTGFDDERMEKYRKMSGAYCLDCDTFLFSMNRHDYHHCGCTNETMVDGGRDYLRSGGKDLSRIVYGTIDLLTDQVVLDSEDQKR